MPLQFSFTVEGPLFDGSASSKLDLAMRKGIEQLALLGQRAAQEQLVPGHGVRTGTLRRAIRGYVTSDDAGQVVVDQPPVIYAAAINFGWPRGYGGMRGSFAGYHYMDIAQQAVEAANVDAVVGPVIVEELG
jgi:hypothetical protein